MPCRNPLCGSKHGRKVYAGYCAKCRGRVKSSFIRWFGKARP